MIPKISKPDMDNSGLIACSEYQQRWQFCHHFTHETDIQSATENMLSCSYLFQILLLGFWCWQHNSIAVNRDWRKWISIDNVCSKPSVKDKFPILS